MADHDEALREHLIELLDGGHAHPPLSRAIDGLPADRRGATTAGVPYSPWMLLEHIRRAQQDILEFSRDPDWQTPAWPDGFWPDEQAPPSDAAWDEALEQFERDLEAMKELVRDDSRDLYEPFAWGDGQTLLREAMLVADHNSYHTGQIVALRRALGCW